MKSNLALLEKVVDTAVAHELGEPAKHEEVFANINPQRHRHVAGLRVVSNAARDAATDPEAAKLFRDLNQFRADSKIIKDKLARVEVAPIAILPRTAWERLCDRTKLYRFKPSREGRVRIATKVIENAHREAASAHVKSLSPAWSLIVPPIVIGLAYFLYHAGASYDLAIILGLFGSMFGVAGTFLWLTHRHFDTQDQLERQIIRAKIESAIKSNTIVELLWPTCREPEEGERHATLRIFLPDPPEDVQKTLVAAERGEALLQLAVVGDAITLRDDPLDALLHHRQREIEKERATYALLDPIVYVTEGSAVAIIAQYGDFPIEQEVINEVVNSVHLA